MKYLLVINGFNYSLPQVYKVRRIKEELSKIAPELEGEVKSTIECEAYFENGSFELPNIKDYLFCIFLDKDKYLSYAISDAIPTFNNAYAIEMCDDKMLTYMALRDNGIKTPKTIPSRLCYDPNPDPLYVKDWIKMVESELPFPLVVKNSYGSLGKQVHLVKNHDQLAEIVDLLLPYPHLYQEFVESSKGHDVRVFTIGGKVVASMERINDKDFRSNIALGGQGYQIDLPPEFKDMAEKVSDILKLDYAGVDIMFGADGHPVLTEVNSNAFFTEIEKVSGINVTRLFVEHILHTIKYR